MVVLCVADEHLLLLHVEMGVFVEIQFAKAACYGKKKNNVMIFMFSFLFLLEDCLCKVGIFAPKILFLVINSVSWLFLFSGPSLCAHPIISMLIQRLFSFVEYRKLLWDHTDCISGSDKCKHRNSHFSKESKVELIVPRVQVQTFQLFLETRSNGV